MVIESLRGDIKFIIKMSSFLPIFKTFNCILSNFPASSACKISRTINPLTPPPPPPPPPHSLYRGEGFFEKSLKDCPYKDCL